MEMLLSRPLLEKKFFFPGLTFRVPIFESFLFLFDVGYGRIMMWHYNICTTASIIKWWPLMQMNVTLNSDSVV